MTAEQAWEPQGVGRRYWIVVVVVVILGLSLFLSFDFGSGAFGPNAWSNHISAVQISTLVVVVAFLLWWLAGRGR